MTWSGVVRRGLWGFGALVILLLAWLLFGRIYAVRRLDAAREAFKQDVGPLDLSAWASPPVPDEENAAIPIRSGALGLVLSGADQELSGELTRHPTDTMTPEQMRGLRRILEANTTALEAISKGARLEGSNFGDELRLDAPRLDADGRPRLPPARGWSPLVGIMNAARILRSRARLESAGGDREQMLTTLETVLGLARAVHQEPRSTSQLIANAVERIGLGAVTAVAVGDDTTASELQRMQAMLLTNDLRAAWKRVQAAETLMLLAGVERAPSTSAADRPSSWERVSRAAWGPVPEAVELELCREFVRLVDLPAALRGPAPELPKGMARLRLFLSGFVSPFTVTKEILRSISLKDHLSSSGRLQATMSQRTLVRLALAIRLQAMVSGVYPEDLSGLLEASAPDLFVGKPLAYERKADGSAVLAIPEGEALWNQVTGGMPTPCPFSVTLPPPARPAPSGAS